MSASIPAIELSTNQTHAFEQAFLAAQAPEIPWGPNPRVGCVIVDEHGVILGLGAHAGAGTPHAEVMALAQAGPAAHGATALVTLEPCAHTGRTGPCSQALLDAGVRRVIFAQADPHLQAAGGAAKLQAAGVNVAQTQADWTQRAREMNEKWSLAHERGRVYLILKVAATLDSFVAAADGSSRWITSEPARQDAHRVRAAMDAIIVGTGTALTDDPALNARMPSGQLYGTQPARFVCGKREIPAAANLFHTAGGPVKQLRTHDPHEILDHISATGAALALLEGGPTLSRAFLAADVVDEVHWYLAPKLLGRGFAAVGDLGFQQLAEAKQGTIAAVHRLGPDLRIDLRI